MSGWKCMTTRAPPLNIPNSAWQFRSPKTATKKPLVVLNTPDGPSDILQKPAGEQQVAGVQGKEDMSGSETAGTVVAAVQETPDDADPDVSGQQAAAPGGAGQAPEGGDASAVAVGAAPAGQQTGIQQDTAGGSPRPVHVTKPVRLLRIRRRLRPP
ncbi:hypothetical protein QW131_05780 [Roseibium salinum]|nr:hypothetical protein [Roseibium salinum]